MAGSSSKASSSVKKLTIGPYTVSECPGVPFEPLQHLKSSLNEVQRTILNNIWFLRNDKKGFSNSLNMLSYHFAENNKFSYYVVFRGRKIGIYSTWQEAVFYVENFSNPCFKGYYSFEEASKALNLYLENERGIEPVVSFQGLFYDRNQVLSFMNNFKSINEDKFQLLEQLDKKDIEIKELQNRLKDLAVEKVLAPQAKDIKKLPVDIQNKIKQYSHSATIEKQLFIMNFFADLARSNTYYEGITFIWQTYHGNTKAKCPKTDPLCIEIPLERSNCKCTLVYSIARASIDMSKYLPLKINYKGEEIVLTPALILDYGLLYQIILSDPDQTDGFGRKIATCILNSFIYTEKHFVDVHIMSKAPEWEKDGLIFYPAQHKILIESKKEKPNLEVEVIPWPCERTMERQLRHWRARIRGGEFEWNNVPKQAKLVAEDMIQKIYSDTDLPEVPFISQTKYTELTSYYKQICEEEMRREEERQEAIDSAINYDEAEAAQRWWEDLGEEERENIINMMEA